MMIAKFPHLGRTWTAYLQTVLDPDEGKCFEVVFVPEGDRGQPKYAWPVDGGDVASDGPVLDRPLLAGLLDRAVQQDRRPARGDAAT